MIVKKLEIGNFQLNIIATSGEFRMNVGLKEGIWRWFSRWAKKFRAKRAFRNQIKTKTNIDQSDINKKTNYSKDELKILETIQSITWYHTFDFGNGLKAEGFFDHTPILERYRLPDNLTNKRVLDVATFDGFWAFEFEKRGAKEVCALDLAKRSDLDLPPERLNRATPKELNAKFGEGFKVAKRLLNSNVKRLTCNVYDLSPDLFGTFDIVHSGDFLLHLKNPVSALQNMARVCTEYAIISDVYSPDLDCFGNHSLLEYRGGHEDITWWNISFTALENMIKDAGFRRVETIAKFQYGPRNSSGDVCHVVFKANKN